MQQQASRILVRPLTRLALIALLLTTVVALSLYVRSISYAETKSLVSSSARTSSDGLEVELLTLRPFGCEPEAIVRTRGAFVLFVNDRTGREDLSLSLQRSKGDSLKEVKTNRSRNEWHDVLDLPPGDYVLSDTANSESGCRITIVP